MNLFFKNISIVLIAINIQSAYAQITNPAQAFKVSAIKSIDQVEVTLTPEPSFFLYKDKIHIFDGNTTKEMKPVEISGKAVLKKFPYAPSHYVYETPVQLYVERPKTQLLKIQYQGCSSNGICLPPQIKYIKVTND